jgi:transposase
MVRRHEVTDEAWARIEPLLPPSGGRGGRWRDHRQVLNAITWKLATGAPWRDVPERYGSWKTAHERLRRWSADGTWDKILQHVQVHNDGVPVDWVIHVDSTSVRAHQHSAGARKRGQHRSSTGVRLAGHARSSGVRERPWDAPEEG